MVSKTEVAHLLKRVPDKVADHLVVVDTETFKPMYKKVSQAWENVLMQGVKRSYFSYFFQILRLVWVWGM